MISIVTAYYNRKKLFCRTLERLQQYAGNVDFEFIAVDDGSDEEERLEDLVALFPFLKIIRLEKKDKWYRNPCIPFNVGIEHIRGDKVILQNPECYHFDDVLSYVEKNLGANRYLSFGCFSLDKENTDSDQLFFNREHIEYLMNTENHVVLHDGGLGWYNHSKYRRAALHFCTAIMAEDLLDLGGFDPRFAWGHGYDDDELIYRIRQKKMKIKFVDHVRVLHQNHYRGPVNQEVKYQNEFAARNKSIYENITKNTLSHRANYLEFGDRKQLPAQNMISKVQNGLMKVKQKIHL